MIDDDRVKLTDEQEQYLRDIRAEGNANKIDYTESKPDRSDSIYNTNMRFIREIYPGLSKEDEDARARRAKSIDTIGRIGNVLSALGNVYTVGNGARSMEIPRYESPDIDAWRRALRGERALATRQKIALAQADEGLYQSDLRQWDRERRSAEAYNARVNASTESAVNSARNRMLSNAAAEQRQERQQQFAKEQAEIKAKAQASKSSGGSKRRPEFVAYDRDGNPHYYYSASAAEQAGRRWGTWREAPKDPTHVTPKVSGYSVKPNTIKKANNSGDKKGQYSNFSIYK